MPADLPPLRLNVECRKCEGTGMYDPEYDVACSHCTAGKLIEKPPARCPLCFSAFDVPMVMKHFWPSRYRRKRAAERWVPIAHKPTRAVVLAKFPHEGVYPCQASYMDGLGAPCERTPAETVVALAAIAEASDTDLLTLVLSDASEPAGLLAKVRHEALFGLVVAG